MKKILILALAMVMCLAVLTSCAENDASQTSSRDTSGSRPVTELTDNEPSNKPEKIVVDEDFYKNLEEKMLQKINELHIGPQGFGGEITALAVNIETAPTHIAGLPVAVNVGCHVTRHSEAII